MRNGFRHFFGARSARVLSSLIVPALLGSLLGGCSGGGGTANPPPPPTDDSIKLTQDNNFTSTSDLSVPTQTVTAADDITIDWSGITHDIQGHAVNPANDINDVSLIRVKSSDPHQVSQWLNLGTLDQTKVDRDFEFQNKAKVTSAKLSQLIAVGGSGEALDPTKDFKADSSITFLVVLATGTQIGFGARMMTILVPDDSSPNGSVMVKDSSAALTYTATMHSPVSVGIDTAPTIDWSGVATNGAGQEIGNNDVDSLLLGFYKGKTVSDLETGFLNLQQSTEAEGGPTESWHLEPMNTQHAALSGAPGRASEAPFANFQTDGATGTWLLGLFCSGCQNPAPVVVTILDPK